MDTLQTVLLVVVIVAAVGAVVYFMRRMNRSDSDRITGSPTAGTGGALREAGANAAFARQLTAKARRRNFAVVTPNPEKSPFAALIISPCGVTAVYGADYAGTVYGSREESWAQVEKGVRRTFRSPLSEAEEARRALRDVLNTGKFRAFMVNAKVVMTARKAELVLPRTLDVFRPKDFLHYVETSPELLTDRKLDLAALEAFLRAELG